MDIQIINRISKLGGPRTIEDVKKICDSLEIKNYKINKDLTVDVRGKVNFYYLGLEKIPLKFGKVDGFFSCSVNQLTSLEGCPKKVNGNFYCSNNKVKFTEDDVRKVCDVKGVVQT